MRVSLRLGLVSWLAILVVAPMAVAQDPLMQSDRQGPVTVAVTLGAPPAIGVPIRAKVVLDTHSVALDGVAFDHAVALRTADGVEVAPTHVEGVKGAGHHREAVVVFPPIGQPGTVRILVKNVGGVAERSFVWELPATK